MALSQFRRSIAAETQKKGSSKGWKGNWRERFRLPKGSPTPFLFIDAEYIDHNPDASQIELDPTTGHQKQVKTAFFKYRKHRRKLMKYGKEMFLDEVCSAGHNPHSPQPCAGCYAMDSGDKSVTLSDGFVLGLIHLHPYHGHPTIDKGGQVVMKNDGSGPYITYDECTGRTCNYCRTLAGNPVIPVQGQQWPNFQAKDISTVFGHRRYIEIGKGHLSDLDGWATQVASICGGTLPNGAPCNSQLITDGYECPHCHSLVIDMESDPRTDEQITMEVMKPYPCLKCQRPVLLSEKVSCDTCGKAVMHSLFNVVLWGVRQGEGTNSHLVLQRSEGLADFAAKVPANILGGKTVQQIVEELGKPYNFEEMYKPKSLAEQAKRLELELPANMLGSSGPTFGQTPQYGAPAQPPQYAAPAYQPYPTGPQAAPGGPPPFVPPTKPNFGN